MIYSFINLKPVKNYATYQVKQIKQNQIKSEQNRNSLKPVFAATVFVNDKHDKFYPPSSLFSNIISIS